MLVQIQQLLDRGHAYIPEGTGDVYYAIDTFPDYGQLSGKKIDELDLGARIAINDVKKHPADFALWKTDPGHLMQWDPHADTTWADFPGERPTLDARIGRGFPGWHIECSAMSLRYLGMTFDIPPAARTTSFRITNVKLPKPAAQPMVTSPDTGCTRASCWSTNAR